MAADLPLKLLLITFAGLVNRDQSRLIAYLIEENRVFRELQGKKRLRLNDDQRRRLAAKAKLLGCPIRRSGVAVRQWDMCIRMRARLHGPWVKPLIAPVRHLLRDLPIPVRILLSRLASKELDSVGDPRWWLSGARVVRVAV